MTVLDVRTGDITTAQADAIATSANIDLKVGGGVNGAIHAAAGPDLAQYCAQLGGCPVGETRVTPAGRLNARHVIHGVAPRWQDGKHGEPTLLLSLYRSVVASAVKHECLTVALPSFGTGAFGFPPGMAAQSAVSALQEALVGDWGDPATPLRLIRWWVASDDTARAYRDAINAASPRLRPTRW